MCSAANAQRHPLKTNGETGDFKEVIGTQGMQGGVGRDNNGGIAVK